MTNSTSTTDEEQPWIPNDPMPAWVCAIGGYEVLADGGVDHAQRWMMQYGMKRHGAIRGGDFLARELHRLRAAVHYGFTWWGRPNEWEIVFPNAWMEKLIKEQAALGDAPMRIFRTASSELKAGQGKRNQGRRRPK